MHADLAMLAAPPLAAAPEAHVTPDLNRGGSREGMLGAEAHGVHALEPVSEELTHTRSHRKLATNNTNKKEQNISSLRAVGEDSKADCTNPRAVEPRDAHACGKLVRLKIALLCTC
jgi:hypothetical protein